MSLATRCSACGTVFRVVQDQLKVSEGWVRCGRCDQVFNALEGLFDLQRDAPPDWSPRPAPPTSDPVLPPTPAADAPAPTAEGSLQHDKIDAQLVGQRSEDQSTPATRIDERDRLEFPDARFDPELLTQATILPGSDADTTAADSSAGPETGAAPAADAAPEFIRRAQRQARWRSPAARAALLGAALVLLAALVLQVGHHHRDLVAARWPVTKPLLLAWCGVAACSIEAPRRIEDVVVESTALTRAGAPETFNLAVALRNRGALTLALPSIDLSLTDPSGQLVARRVLTPRDFRVRSALLAPGAETTLQSVLTAGSARVTGYTVEIFYP